MHSFVKSGEHKRRPGQQEHAGRLNFFIDPPYDEVTYSNNTMMMYHIIWLFMMQDRLALLHKLLADAGHLDFLG